MVKRVIGHAKPEFCRCGHSPFHQFVVLEVTAVVSKEGRARIGQFLHVDKFLAEPPFGQANRREKHYGRARIPALIINDLPAIACGRRIGHRHYCGKSAARRGGKAACRCFGVGGSRVAKMHMNVNKTRE